MQPPENDRLTEGRKLSPKERAGIIGAVAACIALAGALMAYQSTWPINTKANYTARSNCGKAESVAEIEKLPPATKKEQVKELGETIKFLQEGCRGNTGNAVERLEKVKAKWEASVRIQSGRPVSDLKWKPRQQKPHAISSQNMLPKRIMRG